MKHFALAGNPNCGKTTLFNSLTGSTAYVGNWPGVTVDKREGTYKKLEENISIVDLPGIYSLSPYTPEEVISRNFILDEKPDCVINIVDATNLERNLYLTTQILEIDVPVVIALNMMDQLKKEGLTVDTKKLEEKLGVPVILISALKEQGLDDLMKAAYEASQKPRVAKTILFDDAHDLIHLINDCRIAFEAIKVPNPLFHAIKLVELDELETAAHPDLVHIVEEYKANMATKDETFGDDFEALIADARYRYISENFKEIKIQDQNVSSKTKEKLEKANAKKANKKNKHLTMSDKIDKVLTNKWLGIPIFLVILYVIFRLTFAENLFYVSFDYVSFADSEKDYVQGMFLNGGINSIGVILANVFNAFTSWLTELINEGLTLAGASDWSIGLVCDGIFGGLFAVLGFLPQILCLFFFFAILEDSGYMARVAFILDRIFRKFGLSGRSFMPMIMGFGCSVPAIINTRTLADDKERIATIRVIPFFACGAKAPILLAFANGFVKLVANDFAYADLVVYAMYVIGMVVAVLAIIIMRVTEFRGKVPPFIMELPAYHFPQFKSLMVHLWDKAKHFVKKAFTIILLSTIVIWVTSHFTWKWEFIPIESIGSEDITEEASAAIAGQIQYSVLAGLGQIITPIFTPLGFGSQLGSNGWVFSVAALNGLVAKENVIGTIGSVSHILSVTVPPDVVDQVENVEGLDAAYAFIESTHISPAGIISFIVFNLLTIPCFAACATAKAELPKNQFWPTILFWVVTSYVVSMFIYLGFTFYWTLAIFIPIFILIIVGLVLYNKKMNAKGFTL